MHHTHAHTHTAGESLAVFGMSISRDVRSPVDSSCIHKIRDVSRRLLDALKGPLHFLLFGDIAAESDVVFWRTDAEGRRE